MMYPLHRYRIVYSRSEYVRVWLFLFQLGALQVATTATTITTTAATTVML